MQYQEQKLYTGNPRQLFSVRESRLLGGKMDGVRVADIHNGGNLEVCVAVDRCMDIPEIRYRGRVLNYITPNGIVHPSYYNCFGVDLGGGNGISNLYYLQAGLLRAAKTTDVTIADSDTGEVYLDSDGINTRKAMYNSSSHRDVPPRRRGAGARPV